MKIASFTSASLSGMKVFKPIQYLHVQGVCTSMSDAKLRVRVVNSENGRVDEIIPLIGLDTLGEICSMNEGFYLAEATESNGTNFSVNVMLHPTSAVYLSNDKFHRYLLHKSLL